MCLGGHGAHPPRITSTLLPYGRSVPCAPSRAHTSRTAASHAINIAYSLTVLIDDASGDRAGPIHLKR